MAYHVSLINSENDKSSTKLIHSKEAFKKFLIENFSLTEKLDENGMLECYYDHNDPSFTIFYNEGIEGEYYINTTDDKYIVRLISIAKKLNDGTRVRGDDGETYISLERVYIHPDDEYLISNNRVESENSLFNNPSIRIGIIVGVIVCLIQILFFKKW